MATTRFKIQREIAGKTQQEIADELGIDRTTLSRLETAQSKATKRGVPITIVAETLGHSNPVITLSTYAHVIKGGQEIAARAMDDVIGGSA